MKAQAAKKNINSGKNLKSLKSYENSRNIFVCTAFSPPDNFSAQGNSALACDFNGREILV